MSRKLIRKPEVSSRTGLGYGTIRRLVLKEEFPKPVLLTSGALVSQRLAE